ncbi:hypothetical protein WH47_05532 [Habropoda laboriosa]|uniref:Uncharacterized protein n=1 Tax=Habropoda laboriosa TaxID=597456 RepID=A0A0L7RFI8_9HYME|nr:PREDICTED: spore wall protein 2-like [Habropoda laboriosa]KOC69589.1 hypothetical protein WH47_05532 [Habropoda laboriosa]
MLCSIKSMILVCVFVLTGRNDAAPTMEQRMTSSKMSTMDLDSSATGYVYNQQQGLPVYYVQYTNHGSGRYYHTPDHHQLQYVAGGTPVAHVVPHANPSLLPYATAEDPPRHAGQGTGNYGNEQSLEHGAQTVESEPSAPYHGDGKIRLNDGVGEEKSQGESIEEDHDGEEKDGYGVDEKIHGGSGGSTKNFGYGGGYGHGGIGKSRGDGGASFEAGNGEQHAAEKYSEGGENGEKGYETREKYSKGERGSKDDEHQEGYYKNKGGHKKGHVDEAEEHGSHEEEEGGKDGSNYGHLSHHKKGHKTNGFHNVYHKDEYKKESDFYDDDHKKGHFDEYEEFDKGYKSVEGGFKKGGHHSSDHDDQDSGRKGYYDKGHRDSQDQGHKNEEGENSYYSNHEDYGAEEDSKSAKMHKFHKGDH